MSQFDNNVSSQIEGTKLSLEDLIENTKLKFGLLQKTEPEHQKETKEEKISLVHLFKIFDKEGLDRSPTSRKTSPLSKQSRDANPLEFLEESGVFSSDLPTSPSQIELLGKGVRNIEVKRHWYSNLASVKQLYQLITCFSVKANLLLLGTDAGHCYEINIEQDKVLATSKISQMVISSAISEDGNFVAFGGNLGEILVKSVGKGWGKKDLNEKIKNAPVEKLSFISYSDLLALGDNKLFRLKFIKLGIYLHLQSFHLVESNPSPEFSPQGFELLPDRSSLKLVIWSQSQVSFLKITSAGESVEYSLTKPESVRPNDTVYVYQIAVSIYSIFWGHMFLLIKKLNLNDQLNDDVEQNQEDMMQSCHYEVLERIDVGFRFSWASSFNDFGLLFLRNESKIRIAGIGNYSKLIKKGCYIDPEEVSFKDIPGLGTDYLGFASNIQNKHLKLQCGSLLVLESNEFKTIQLVPTNKLISMYVDNGQWHQALRIAVRMFLSTSYTDKNRDVLKENLQIVSVKYINYFIPQYKRGESGQGNYYNSSSGGFSESNMFGSGSTNDLADVRLKLIVQTLLVSDNVQFVFEDLKRRLKPEPFWRAIGRIMMKTDVLNVKLSYLSEEIVILPEDIVEKIIELSSHKEGVDGTNQELLQKLVQSLKRSGYWKCLYKLSLHYPASNACQLFLTALLSNSMPTSLAERERLSILFSSSSMKHLYSSSKLSSQTIQSDTLMTNLVRFYFYLRKYVHLTDLSYAKSKEVLWGSTFDWILDTKNLYIIAQLNLNLLLEVFSESLLNSELILNQKFLQSLQKSMREEAMFSQFKIIETTEVSSRRTRRKLDDDELREFSMKVVKELTQYLKDKLAKEFKERYLQDIAFFSIKLFHISIMRKITSDSAFILTFAKDCVRQKFRVDHFYYFYKIIDKFEFENIVSKCLEKTFASNNRLHDSVLSDILELAEINQYFGVGYTIRCQMDGVEKALYEYMGRDVNILDAKFIFQVLDRCKNESEYCKDQNVLYTFITANISKLVFLNSAKTYEMLQAMDNFKFDIEKLHYLDPYPRLQLDFLMRNMDECSQWTRETKIKFLDLVSTYEPNRLVAVLESNSFPLDEAVEIAKRDDNWQALSFLQLKMGLYEEVTATSARIIKQKVAQCLSDNTVEPLSDVIFSFELISKEFCTMLSKSPEDIRDAVKSYFFQLIEVMSNLEYELVKRKEQYKRFFLPENDEHGIKSYEVCEQVYSAIQELILYKLFDQLVVVLSPQDIRDVTISIIERNLPIFDLRGIIKSLVYELTQREHIETEYKEQNLKTLEKLVAEKKQATGRSNYCSQCNMKLDFATLLLHRCRHPVTLFCAGARSKQKRKAPDTYACPQCSEETLNNHHLQKLIEEESSALHSHAKSENTSSTPTFKDFILALPGSEYKSRQDHHLARMHQFESEVNIRDLQTEYLLEEVL